MRKMLEWNIFYNYILKCKLSKEGIVFIMDRKEYLLNEVGIEIARENIAKLMRKAMQESDKNKFKTKSNILLQDM